MKTAALIVFPLLLGLAFALAVIGTFRTDGKSTEGEAEEPDPRAWIDDRAAAETNPARRMAWRMLRHDDLENL